MLKKFMNWKVNLAISVITTDKVKQVISAGKLVIPRTFLFFSVSRLIGVKWTRIDAEYGNNLSPNLLQLFSLCTESYKTFPK